METKKNTSAETVADQDTPRKLSLAENAILTVKVLGGVALIGAAVWGMDLLTTAAK